MDIFLRFKVTRISRLKTYLAELAAQAEVRKSADREKLALLKKQSDASLLKMRVLTGARMFFYILLYASIISNFIGDIRVFELFTTNIALLSSIIGTTISLLFILLLTKSINVYWEDVRTYATHMIAIYAKYDVGAARKEEGKPDF